MLSESIIQRLQDPANRRLFVALSGGVDSVVLLDLVAALGTKNLSAIHVNHHLHEHADLAADFCRELADRHGIPLQVADVEVKRDGSLEANARAARYAAFESMTGAGDLLLMAHHADDQVETILLRMLRGGGPAGLQGMPEERPLGRAAAGEHASRLLRPLLACTREEILAYAGHCNLSWIEDPTNLDTSIDRNYLRHELLPAMEARFPLVRQTLLADEARDRQAREALQQVLVAEMEPLRPVPDALDKEALSNLQEQQLSALLLAWLMDLGLPLPGNAMMAELVAQVRAGHNVTVESGSIAIREHRGLLYATRPLPPFEPENGGTACVANSRVKGSGLRDGDYNIRYRQGGETIRIRHARSLKNIFQEQSVPTWLRDRVPLLYHHDELVAVAAVPGWGVPMLVADGWGAIAEEAGIHVELRPGDRIWGIPEAGKSS